MLKTIHRLILISALTCLASAAHSHDLDSLDQPATGVARRASSADPVQPHGPFDYVSVTSGSEGVLADLSGPGRITHCWFTIGTNAAPLPEDWATQLELRFRWDNETTPSVEVPFNQFFAQGPHGKTAIDTAAVRVAGNQQGGYACYWPMPFNQRAQISLINHLPFNLSYVYFHIDWVQLDQPVANPWYFHAQGRSEPAKQPGTGDYLLADITGPGRYVGTVYAVGDSTTTEMFEADDRFFVDGDTTPTLSGTGTEDYAGGAWGPADEQGLYAGMILDGNGFTLYRWHIPDSIPFQHSLRVSWENWGFNGVFFGEQTYSPSSVSFWYGPRATLNSVANWWKM